MSAERVRELLKQLRSELDRANVDAETLASMRALDRDIRRTLDASERPVAALTDRAKAIEVEFAVKHGVAERILREIVETLAKIGV
ncbi:MAG TPA: DUF4404 family protein [Pseudomonadales bacterium]|nr:DUF4404 family protein [Pseudomonadales bacterium]